MLLDVIRQVSNMTFKAKTEMIYTWTMMSMDILGKGNRIYLERVIIETKDVNFRGKVVSYFSKVAILALLNRDKQNKRWRIM